MTSLLARLRDVELVVERPRRTRILHPIDLDIGRAGSLSVVGPSGAGKSSLVSVLGALQPPSGGSYRFGEVEVTDLDTAGAAGFRRRHVGFVFQSANLVEERSAWRNVALALAPEQPRADRERRSRAALEQVGLGDVADREAALLSGGERQRVAVARALVAEPELVIADEPTGALDRATGRDVLELLYALPAMGRTLVVVTHEQRAAEMAERTIEIVDGRLRD